MKEKLLSIFTLAITMAMCVCLTSCGDDDERSSSGPDNQNNALIGYYSISGIETSVQEQTDGITEIDRDITGTIAITSKDITITYTSSSTGGAIIQCPYTIVGNTIRLQIDKDETQVYEFTLSADKGTLSVSYLSGCKIYEYWNFYFKQLSGKRVESNETKPVASDVASSVKGTWYRSYMEQGTQKYDISSSDEAYDEFSFYDNGKASWKTYTGDNIWMTMPVSYRIDDNKIILDFEQFINLPDENGSNARRVFTYDKATDMLMFSASVTIENQTVNQTSYYQRR